MMFYAIEWAYGRVTDTNTGERIGTYWSFDTRQERAAFCADGPAATTQNGYREPIKASDAELRGAKANGQVEHWIVPAPLTTREKLEMDWPKKDVDEMMEGLE